MHPRFIPMIGESPRCCIKILHLKPRDIVSCILSNWVKTYIYIISCYKNKSTFGTCNTLWPALIGIQERCWMPFLELKWPNDIKGQGQWPPFSITIERILRCIFGANLVILAQIHYQLLHRQAKFPRILSQNGHFCGENLQFINSNALRFVGEWLVCRAAKKCNL